MQNYLRWPCIVALLLAVGSEWPQPCRLSAQETKPAVADDLPPAPPSGAPAGLLDLNLEQLSKQDVVVPSLDIVVNSVTREVSTVGQSAAAVFVITPEMIRRCGATSIPEVLRMAPGLEVAKIDANTWAVSARGFNKEFSNKLLVMIDRRVVYNALFGGVYWDVQDVVLQDVERIEVIRGPGTVAWGSNAVNGVINIITKRPGDTQGALVYSAGGNQDLNNNTVRYGGQAEDLKWRVYGREFNRNTGFDPTGPAYDAWRQNRGGFRTEWTPTQQDTCTCQGDIYNGFSGGQIAVALPVAPYQQTSSDPTHVSGGNSLLRWSHVIDDQTNWQLQAFYDSANRNTISQGGQNRNTYDIDFQNCFALTDRQQVICGGDYRASDQASTGTFALTFPPAGNLTQWASLFVEDKITLVDDRWFISPGARLEYNTFGGLQAEPSTRLLFLPDDRHSCWAAISRAACNPTQSEDSILYRQNVVPGTPTFLQLTGNPNLVAESLMAYELGFRGQPSDRFSWDIALFINNYHNLLGTTIGQPFVAPPYVLIPVGIVNNVGARTAGVELTATWQLRESWKIFGSYTYLDISAHGPSPEIVAAAIGSSPNNQVYLRSSWNLGRNVDYDLIGRYVDSLQSIGVPSYITMDMRLAWRIRKNLEAAVVGQNLLAPHHVEFIDPSGGLIDTQVPRSVYGSLTWTW
jgi:iron complex outermembrane receptor protein